MKERWRKIPGFDGYYASSAGRIRSHRKSVARVLKPSYVHGYPSYSLMPGKRFMQAHRLVLMAFRGLPRKGFEAAHLNGKRQDARLSNLRWVTASENWQHRFIHGTDSSGERNVTSKLTWSAVEKIRALRKKGALLRELAQRFGVTEAQVSNIVNLKQWRIK